MFQFVKPTASVRLNKEEITLVNSQLQLINDKVALKDDSFKSHYKDLVKFASLDTPPALKDNERVIVVSEELQNALSRFVSEFETEDKSFENIFIQAVDIALRPLPEAPTVEVYKEKELTENQLLIECSDNELKVLERIQKNRSRKLPQPEPIPNLLKSMAFNKGTLYNRSGCFYTGY